MEDFIKKSVNAAIGEYLEQGKMPKELPVEELLLRHQIEIMGKAFREERAPSVPKKLAKFPRSLSELKNLWDQYRKTGKVPKDIKTNADNIRKAYVKKCGDVFERYSQDYRSGSSSDKQEIVKKVQKAADTVVSRAKNIVGTETTRYYNKARRELYDQSVDVTHYLFLAIRDFRTSKWCTEKVGKEGRGRHGLVYKKGDPLTDRETPSVHWWCRSEMVPLSPLNPRHLVMIEDKSKQRRNHKCTPLPKGWNQ